MTTNTIADYGIFTTAQHVRVGSNNTDMPNGNESKHFIRLDGGEFLPVFFNKKLQGVRHRITLMHKINQDARLHLSHPNSADVPDYDKDTLIQRRNSLMYLCVQLPIEVIKTAILAKEDFFIVLAITGDVPWLFKPCFRHEEAKDMPRNSVIDKWTIELK